MADDEAEINKLWRIRKTILQLCHDRGYMVTSDELEQTLDQFKQTYGDRPSQGEPSRSKLIVLVSHINDPTDQLYVFFPDDAKVGVKTIVAYIKKMEEEEITRAIIVVSTGMSPSAKKAIADMQPKYVFEPFLDSELMVNITNHFVSEISIPFIYSKQKLFCFYSKLEL